MKYSLSSRIATPNVTQYEDVSTATIHMCVAYITLIIYSILNSAFFEAEYFVDSP